MEELPQNRFYTQNRFFNRSTPFINRFVFNRNSTHNIFYIYKSHTYVLVRLMHAIATAVAAIAPTVM